MIKQENYFKRLPPLTNSDNLVLVSSVVIRHCSICGNKLRKADFLGRKNSCEEDWEDERLAIPCCHCCCTLRMLTHPNTTIKWIYYCDKWKYWVFFLDNPVHKTYNYGVNLKDKEIRLLERFDIISQDWFKLVDNKRKPRACK